MSRFWAVATGSIILDIPLRVSFLGPDSDTLVLFTEDEVRQALSALPETAALPDWDFSDSHISVGRFPIRGGAARRRVLRLVQRRLRRLRVPPGSWRLFRHAWWGPYGAGSLYPRSGRQRTAMQDVLRAVRRAHLLIGEPAGNHAHITLWD